MKHFDENRLPGSDLSLGDVLILALPGNADLNLLADAFVTFIEEELETMGDRLVLTAEPFAWKEVLCDEFDTTCAAFLEKAGHGPYLQAVWAKGRIGIVSANGALDHQARGRLLDRLISSQARVADPAHEWRILDHSAQSGPMREPTRALARADRSLPIVASRTQRAALALSRQRADGRHGVVAMRPIVISMPDREALAASFAALMRRHDILRMELVANAATERIRLTEPLAPPFECATALRPFRHIDLIASERSQQLAQEPLTAPPLWRAQLVEDGAHGIVICILFDVIADTRTAELLRGDILQLYAGCLAGRDPDHDWPVPVLSYWDVAAAEPDLQTSREWWQDHLPASPRCSAGTAMPPIAPVEVFEHALSVERMEQLITTAAEEGAALEGVVLSIFLKAIADVEDTPPDWLLIALHGQRPEGLELIPGPFAMDAPVWIGDIKERLDPRALSERVAETAAFGAAPHRHLAQALPGLMPAHIAHRFDWREDALLLMPCDAAAGLSLTVAHHDMALHLQWTLRLDHPGAATARSFAQRFLRHLDATVTLRRAIRDHLGVVPPDGA